MSQKFSPEIEREMQEWLDLQAHNRLEQAASCAG
jgi:hypothetical protein